MSNRFAPPLSDVGEQPEPRLPPPGVVALAVRLLWISLALGIPSFLYEFTRSSGGSEFGISIAIQLAFAGLAAYINVSIYRARNWARLLGLALTVLELGVLVFGPTPAEEAVIEVVCNWVAAALDAGAMYLLFTRVASAWFKQKGGRLTSKPSSDQTPKRPGS
jgi:hypothetical protein